MILSFILIIVGLAVLVVGAEYLVKGASSVSKKFGISSLVIGLTVVSFGTSAPELIVNLVAAFSGNTDIALGNIVGSNLTNILLILGASALIINLKVKNSTTWKEIPFALLAIAMVYILGNDVLFDGASVNVLSRIDGLVLLSFFIIFMYYIFGLAKQENIDRVKEGEVEEEVKSYATYQSVFMIIGGLLGLFFGGKLLVDNAVLIAQSFGLSELLIGTTIVAIGTSLPELATSIVAARRGEDDIAIGNIVGSNIFNIFWILGITSIITPVPVSSGSIIDIIFTTIVTAMLFVFIFIRKKYVIEKWQGFLFVLIYIAYLVYLINRG